MTRHCRHIFPNQLRVRVGAPKRSSLESHLENLKKFQAQAPRCLQPGQYRWLQLDYRKAKPYFQAAHLAPENSTYLNDAGRINHTLGAYGAAITYFEGAGE